MVWIVLGEEKGNIALVSKTEVEKEGILHQGSYLTIDDREKKFILRVEDTSQYNPYSPSPRIVDMDLSPLYEDQKCQNIIYASRIVEIPERNDGKSSFIKPQMTARRSNQDEINMAFENKKGIPVFPATAFARSSQILCDDDTKLMHVNIPEDIFFYQMLIAGRTGSGKTVSMKYLAQYFIEKLKLDDYKESGPGAVLAVNVKEEDMLTLDKASSSKTESVKKEWEDLGLKPHGIETFRIYYPGYQPPRYSDDIDMDKCEKITLLTEHTDPETLTGLIQNISERGADQLPAIFRYWQKKVMKPNNNLSDFICYFSDPAKERLYPALTSRDEEIPIKLFPGTYQNLLNALSNAVEYFDVEGGKELVASDIIQPGKMSVIDVTSKHGFGFGSVLLRDLLEKIYDAKSGKEIKTPVLIIIDEVHEFYSSTRSKAALQTLNSICRKGRSLQIGVIFASQSPEDIPKDINSVVNTKIYFKSDIGNIRSLGINVSRFDPESLKAGYCIATIHGLSQLKFIKFPMALSGVQDEKKDN